MANTYTVKKGDTLSGIAKKFNIGTGSPAATKWMNGAKQLASINGIKNINRIYVGQVIKLTGSASSGDTGTKTNSNAVTITQFGLQSNTDNTLFAVWTWGKTSQTENYKTMWYYDTGDGHWFVGSDSTTEYLESTYNIPSNAKAVKFKVKPISKTHTVNKKETTYWTADWSTEKKYDVSSNPPLTPSTPSVEIDELTLTAELENIDHEINADKIQFQVVKNDTSVFKTGTADIILDHASFSCTVDVGGKYKVRCRAYRSSDNVYSNDWSQYSSNVGAKPAAPTSIQWLKVLSITNNRATIQLHWNTKTSSGITSEIEYTTEVINFDSAGGNTSSYQTDDPNEATITNLDPGATYFFRVRSVNDAGNSDWSEIKSIAVGTKPAAPTTWSSSTSVITGEPLNLYWLHNATDGSAPTSATITLYINDSNTPTTIGVTYTQENDRIKYNFTPSQGTGYQYLDEIDGQYSASVLALNTADYPNGANIKWSVKTAGISNQLSDSSSSRTIDIYDRPTMDLSLTDGNENAIEVLTSFPFYLGALVESSMQYVIGYHVTVTANESYETIDNIGNDKYVGAGDQVYSKYFDITNMLMLTLSANNIDLENNISYTVTCVASMNSGLSIEDSIEFSVAWSDEILEPNAEITYDPETFVTHIHPYCENKVIRKYKVVEENDEYVVTNTVVDSAMEYTGPWSVNELAITISDISQEEITESGSSSINDDPITNQDLIDLQNYLDDLKDRMNAIKNVVTDTGLQVHLGVLSEPINGEIETLYCEVIEDEEVPDITLAVYRREYDGTFTELATGLENSNDTFITDPHPSLDFARYRIVATIISTGAVSYFDVPGYPISETAVIIQWDEKWSVFDATTEDELEEPVWAGSLLRLPYNIDVSDKHSTDVSLVEYIGRKRPVSYYGTQLGESSTWNMDIPKSDKDTLYALRRLAIWAGDAYVREPSGSGYWANVSISFSQKHTELTIPITLEIVRVEGGA